LRRKSRKYYALIVLAAITTGFCQMPTSPEAPNEARAGVLAALNKTIDAKKAKQGDKIEAHTTQAAKGSNGADIPKGSKLVGHVTAAKAHSKQDPGSTLGIVFDEVVLKNGESVPFKAAVLAVAPPPPPPTVATTNMDSAQTGGAAGAPSAPRAGASSAPSDSAGVVGSGGQFGRFMIGDVQLNPNSRGAIGLPGVTLQSEVSGQAGGSVLTSKGQNVKLESGTKLVLQPLP
jgi:hypothetical protein